MALQLQGLRVELNEEKTIKLKASKAQELPAYVWILGLARFFGCIVVQLPCSMLWLNTLGHISKLKVPMFFSCFKINLVFSYVFFIIGGWKVPLI